MLYLLKFRILESSRSDCMTFFGGMTAEDDRRDAGDVEIVGRWSTVGESSGYCVCRAGSAAALHAWMLNWSTMATIECWPVVDDNQARRILLSHAARKPCELPSPVDYSRAGHEAKPGESLFFIEYAFLPGKREEGSALFANLGEDEDVEDTGKNTCYGRWHNLGLGTGVAICSSASEEDLHAWATRWMALCECAIRPVVTDAQCRANLRAKPDFAEKHAALVARTQGKPPRFSWWR